MDNETEIRDLCKSERIVNFSQYIMKARFRNRAFGFFDLKLLLRYDPPAHCVTSSGRIIINF